MMHELSITQNLIDLVAGECKKKNIIGPKKIIAELGSLTGYSKESILFYYDLFAKRNASSCRNRTRYSRNQW